MPPPSSSKTNPRPVTQPKFDEAKWYKKWNGFDAYQRHTHQAIKEIFRADDEYWKTLEERVRKAYPAKIDEKTLKKFPGAIRARAKFLKTPLTFFNGYESFDESFADAVFLKDLIGKLRSPDPSPAKGTLMPKLDQKTKSGATKPESSSKTKGAVIPKLDKSSKPSARASTTVSKSQGTIMPKLDSRTRAPEPSTKAKGTVMPKLDNIRKPSSSTALIKRPAPTGTRLAPLDKPSSSGTRMPPLDRLTLQPSTTQKQIRFANGDVIRQETHERKVIPVTTDANGVQRWGVQERVQVREVRMMQQAFSGKRNDKGEVVWTAVDPGSLGGLPVPPGWDGLQEMGGSGGGSGKGKKDGGSGSGKTKR